MNRRLLWKLCLTIATGVVALFYFINLATTMVENDMSMLDAEHVNELKAWSFRAEELYLSGDQTGLENWLSQLQQQEQTWAAVAKAQVEHIAGSTERYADYTGYNMGRSVDWQIHLYFHHNPIMELPFADAQTSLLIELPVRMRPGSYWTIARVALQIILPLLVLILVSIILYRHIMGPLKELEAATRAFSKGDFDVRVSEMIGTRDDELAQLTRTFDRMADRIGDLIVGQRQLITDLSHELRTPLTRLDIATENLIDSQLRGSDAQMDERLERIHRESRHIRKLVDDTLTLSWLENESPTLRQESLDLVDLLEVLIEDARFEYPNRDIQVRMLDTARVQNSNHRVLGQAIENILRNALRYTPEGKAVMISLDSCSDRYELNIADQGPGVPEKYLEAIFRPFFRVDTSRPAEGNSFGLGLALARRQLLVVAASVRAANLAKGGLLMSVSVPSR